MGPHILGHILGVDIYLYLGSGLAFGGSGYNSSTVRVCVRQKRGRNYPLVLFILLTIVRIRSVVIWNVFGTHIASRRARCSLQVFHRVFIWCVLSRNWPARPGGPGAAGQLGKSDPGTTPSPTVHTQLNKSPYTKNIKLKSVIRGENFSRFTPKNQRSRKWMLGAEQAVSSSELLEGKEEHLMRKNIRKLLGYLSLFCIQIKCLLINILN